MPTRQWPGAQIWFRHRWRKLVTASLLLHYIGGFSCLRYWNEFFQVCSRFYIEVFSYCSLTETYAIAFPKWFDNEWIDFGFFVGKWLLSSTFYLYGLKSARIAELLLSFEDIKFFRCLVRGVFWSVLQKWLFFLGIWFCDIDWQAVEQQCNFTLCLVLSSSLFFLEVVINVFDYFWKPNSLFSKFCVNSLLMLYFVYCNNCALKDVNVAS